MNTPTVDEKVDGISIDILRSVLASADTLTKQEIEAGLDSLHQEILRKPLPFIVLIEDDPDEALLFRQALRSAGVPVEFMHICDGLRAIDFFNGKGCYSDRDQFPLPQLTVLDLHLIRSSGLEILHEIRTSPQLKRLVVVALTGSEDVHEFEEARSLEINEWIHKPQCAKDLIGIVRCLLRTWLPSSI